MQALVAPTECVWQALGQVDAAHPTARLLGRTAADVSAEGDAGCAALPVVRCVAHAAAAASPRLTARSYLRSELSGLEELQRTRLYDLGISFDSIFESS